MGEILKMIASAAGDYGPQVLLAALAVGGIIWYVDRRASEDHDSEQSQIDRLADRVTELESKVDKQRTQLDAYAEKLAKVRAELSQAEIAKGRKDAQITRLQAEVDALQQKVRRLEQESEPSLAHAPTDPSGEGAA